MTTAAPAAPSANGNGATNTRPTLQEACDAAVKARSWVYSQNVESNPLIDLLMLSAISGRHGLIRGEGGTGKSKVVRDWFKVLPGSREEKFITQFRKDMDTQAIFGPIAVSGLMRDEFMHALEGYMAKALWVFADEFCDASTLILRALLMLMEERQFPNGKLLIDAPIRALIGSTNFERDDPDVAALMDRFAWRYEKKEVESEAGVLAIIDGQLTRRASGGNLVATTPPPTLTLDELNVLRDAVDACVVPMDVRKAGFKLKMSARAEGIRFSNRRLGEGFALAQAHAVMRGSDTAALQDLIVFGDVIATTTEDTAKARELCAEFAGTAHKAAMELRGTLDPLQTKTNALKVEIDAAGGRVNAQLAQKVVALISEVNIVIENVDAKTKIAQADGSDTGPLDALGAEANSTVEYLRDMAMANMGGRR